VKADDEVIITVDEKELNYIHEYNRNEIANNPSGIIRHVFKEGCDVRTSSGIWYIPKELLTVKGDK